MPSKAIARLKRYVVDKGLAMPNPYREGDRSFETLDYIERFKRSIPLVCTFDKALQNFIRNVEFDDCRQYVTCVVLQ